MSRIDEIKRKLEWSSYHGDISPSEVVDDVEYLLSRLEIAENELIKIRELTYDCRNPNESIINQKAIEALQQIRE